MPNDDVTAHVSEARARLGAVREAAEADAPWPLAERFDHAPEAAWGPPEVLAHITEMIAYWETELTRVATSGAPEPVPFGRVPTDDDRLANIRRERTRPIGDLFDSVTDELDAFEARWSTWTVAQRAQIGLHPSRGQISVAESAEAMIAGHLGAHVDQLEAILGIGPTTA